jgi:hypothetical protein
VIKASLFRELDEIAHIAREFCNACLSAALQTLRLAGTEPDSLMQKK